MDRAETETRYKNPVVGGTDLWPEEGGGRVDGREPHVERLTGGDPGEARASSVGGGCEAKVVDGDATDMPRGEGL